MCADMPSVGRPDFLKSVVTCKNGSTSFNNFTAGFLYVQIMS